MPPGGDAETASLAGVAGEDYPRDTERMATIDVPWGLRSKGENTREVDPRPFTLQIELFGESVDGIGRQENRVAARITSG